MCNLLLIMLLLAAQVTDVYAQAPGEEKKVTESEVHDVTEEVPNSYDEDLEVELEVYESDNGYVKAIFAPGEKNTAYVPYTCQIYTTKKMELTVNSSNENVVKGKNTVLETYEPGYCFESGTLGVEICGVGYCTLTFSLGNVTKTMDVCVVPQSVEITKIQQTDAQKAMISWKKVSGCSGYILERSEDEYGDYKEISRTTGSQSTATVISEWDKNYYYRVIGYVKAGDKTENNDYYSRYTKSKSFVITKPTAVLKSVEQKGKSSLKVTWEKMGYATGYELYQKEGLSKAKCIYKGNKTSFKKKITKGKQYTFYVIARYSKKASKKSNSIMAYLPKSGKVVGTRQESVEQIDMQEGQYQWYSADSDEIFYYTANDKMYMVVRQEQKLYIYQMDAKNKYKPFKIIDLGKLDYWGGFYHGTDGKFYVAVGFDNMKENDKKTVIKVYQYSSKWKKMKTCNIKGSIER